MRSSDWSSDGCSSDLPWLPRLPVIVVDHLFERGSGDVHAHFYPATAQVTGEIALAAPQDVDAAVQAARAACPAWRALPGNQRRDLLLKLAALLEQNQIGRATCRASVCPYV